MKTRSDFEAKLMALANAQLSRRIIVAYGGGVNSTAMLVAMYHRNIKPDLVLFADTGGERPETYTAVQTVSQWIEARGMPAIVTVREPCEPLEVDCLRRQRLPSIAFGFKSCSDRWKRRPCDRYVKAWMKPGETLTKAVGFDAGEERRIKQSDDRRWVNWYPLIEWGIYREDCETICRDAGLPVVKSSCFFCPSMKKAEVLALNKDHPELMERALTMERQAKLTSIKGLGRHWAWGDLIAAENAQMQMFCDAAGPEIPCGCYDG